MTDTRGKHEKQVIHNVYLKTDEINKDEAWKLQYQILIFKEKKCSVKMQAISFVSFSQICFSELFYLLQKS